MSRLSVSRLSFELTEVNGFSGKSDPTETVNGDSPLPTSKKGCDSQNGR